MRSNYILLFLIIVSIGCSTSSGGKSAQGNRYLIIAEEIDHSAAVLTTAHDVVRILRPTLFNISQRNNFRSVSQKTRGVNRLKILFISMEFIWEQYKASSIFLQI
jgi:hypothetical protein